MLLKGGLCLSLLLRLGGLDPEPFEDEEDREAIQKGVIEVEAQYYCGRDLIARKC